MVHGLRKTAIFGCTVMEKIDTVVLISDTSVNSNEASIVGEMDVSLIGIS